MNSKKSRRSVIIIVVLIVVILFVTISLLVERGKEILPIRVDTAGRKQVLDLLAEDPARSGRSSQADRGNLLEILPPARYEVQSQEKTIQTLENLSQERR